MSATWVWFTSSKVLNQPAAVFSAAGLIGNEYGCFFFCFSGLAAASR